ncbi:actin-domain-containing protein [Blastocladiella britannica]|nr:actin-domain-containing protein [Blastocladiella britannica]
MAGTSGGSAYYAPLDDRIVLDIGSVYTKVGFAGEHSPRFIVANRSRHKSAERAERVQFWDLVSDARPFFGPAQSRRLEYYLGDHLTDVFFRSLLTDPRGKSVVVVEPALMPILVKQTLAKVLFERFRVGAVHFAPADLMAVLTTGRPAGLVLECGYLETTAVPVYDHRVLHAAAVSVPVGGASVLANLRDLLTKFGSLLTPIDDFRGYTSGRTPTSGHALSSTAMSAPGGPNSLVVRGGGGITDRLTAAAEFWYKWSNWALGLTSRLGIMSGSPETMAMAAGVGHGHTLVPWTDVIADALLTPAFLEEILARAVYIGPVPLEGESVLVTEPSAEELAEDRGMTPPASPTRGGGSTGFGGGSGAPLDMHPPSSSFIYGAPRSNSPTNPDAPPPVLIHQYRIHKSSASTVYYPLGERGQPIGGNRNMKLILPGWVRERACEPLFAGGGGDPDARHVATAVLEALARCPRDVRGAVARNVVVSGGMALVPGFLARVRDEVVLEVDRDPRWERAGLLGIASVVQFVTPGHGQFQCGPWVGASLAAVMKLLGQKTEISARVFDEWCSEPGDGWLVQDWTILADVD